MNKIKKTANRPRPKAAALPMRTRRFFVRFFRAVNLFGYLDVRTALRSLPFVLFLSGLALLFIANGYYTERIVRHIDGVNTEIKELKSEFIYTKSELMKNSGPSNVAEAVAPLGLEESREAPVRLEPQSTTP
jgi:hypothetical protein